MLYKCCLKNLERVWYPSAKFFLPSSSLSWRQRRVIAIQEQAHVASSRHPAVWRVRVVLVDVLALVLSLDSFEDLVHLLVSWINQPVKYIQRRRPRPGTTGERRGR